VGGIVHGMAGFSAVLDEPPRGIRAGGQGGCQRQQRRDESDLSHMGSNAEWLREAPPSLKNVAFRRKINGTAISI
jgi:hypothetical protein